MFHRRSVNFALLSVVIDQICTLLALLLAAQVRLWNPTFLEQTVSDGHVPAGLYVMVSIVWLLTFLYMSVYDPNRVLKASDEIQVVTLAVAIAGLVFAGTLYVTYRELSRALFLFFIAFDLIAVLTWRISVRFVRRQRRSGERKSVVILGAGDVGIQLANMINTYGRERLRLVGYLDDDVTKHGNELPILGTLDELPHIATQLEVDEIIIALPRRAHQRINEIVAVSHTLPVNVRIIPDYFSLALYRAKAQDFAGIPMISLREPALNDVQRFVKRLLDIAIASTALLFLSPILGLIALAIKIDSSGPIFFMQERVGENGRMFKMFKLRSMVVNAEALQSEVNDQKDGQIIHKQKNDPRVTRVGQFIRRASIDELPQLLNVLLGDMSIVGPRPELPWLVKEYAPWQRKRFAVPQGITGWWQINGRSDKPMHLHTDEDIYYIQNYSLWLDIIILIKTPLVVLRGKGAY